MSFEFAYRFGGGVARVKEFPSAASKAHKKGTPVNLESGLLDLIANGDTAVVGVANEDVTTGSGVYSPVEVVLATPDTVFRADFTNAGTKKTFTNADIGSTFDVSSSDVDVIDPDDTTGGMWVVVGFDNTKLKVYVTLSQESASLLVGGGPDATS